MDSSGRLLAAPQDPSKEVVKTFTVGKSHTSCTVDLPISNGSEKGRIQCKDGSYGEVYFSSGDHYNSASFFMHVSKSGYRENIDAARDIPQYVGCGGKLVVDSSGIDPFIVTCSYGSVTFKGKTLFGGKMSYSKEETWTFSGAVEVKRVSQEMRRFTVWTTTGH